MAAGQGLPGRTLIGGVGYRWMRDRSFGAVAADALARLEWPEHVEVSDLGYGAILITDDLLHAEPPYARLILIAATERGRKPGRLYRSTWNSAPTDPEEVQSRIREAGAGVIDLDHLLVIGSYFGALPEDVALIEFEPVETSGGVQMTPAAEACLQSLVTALRIEIGACSFAAPAPGVGESSRDAR